MIDLAHARRLALALPEAVEQDHHGMPSFRVRGKIFATTPDEEHLRVMVDEGEIRACVAQDPAAFAELWWGSRLACVVVDLGAVDGEQLVHAAGSSAWNSGMPGRDLTVDGGWLRAGGTGAGAGGRQARIGRPENAQNLRTRVLAELLADAWRRKAPRALVRAHDAVT